MFNTTQTTHYPVKIGLISYISKTFPKENQWDKLKLDCLLFLLKVETQSFT